MPARDTDQPLRSVWDAVTGVRVHGRVSSRAHAGTGTGTPIVFVHGLGASTRYMEPTMARLARDFDVAALDLPGFGRSGTPDHAYTLAELARALEGWLDARGIGPAVLVGNSYGCQVIVECVARSPARALGLVLNAPTMDPAHRSAPGVIARVIADVPREPWRLACMVACDYLRAGPLRLLATLGHALDDRIEEVLPTLAMPVLVVAGARDPVVTVHWAEEVARLVGTERPGAAGAELRVVSHAAHALPYDDPATFAALVAAFVERIGARGSSAAASA
jgi:pimeloyl-ACP methyl ester carboxylesterase